MGDSMSLLILSIVLLQLIINCKLADVVVERLKEKPRYHVNNEIIYNNQRYRIAMSSPARPGETKYDKCLYLKVVTK